MKKEWMKIAVEESEKTKKTREKIKQRLKQNDILLTKEALEQKSREIAGWIERHATDRISVKKDISLFDQNRNSAKMSRAVEKMAEEIGAKLKNERD